MREFFRAAPGGVPTQVAFSQDRRWEELDLDREQGVIRDAEHPFSKDGGLAVLNGNIALDGCIVKTAGVDESILKFSGPAKVFESQDAAVKAILGNEVKAGDVVVIRYEGPSGGPGMQEMLYPTSYLKSKGLGKACALITDGRFSGGTSGLSIGHASPEAAEGGAIGLVREGDIDRDRHPEPHDQPGGRRCRAGRAARRAGQAGLEAGGEAQAQGDHGAEGLCRLCDQRRQGRRAQRAAGIAALHKRFPAASNQCSFSALATTRSRSPGLASARPETRTTMRLPAAAQ